jgi:hypothetical protein
MRIKHPSRENELLGGARPFQPVRVHANQIVLRAPASLRVNPRNAHTHLKKQIRQIAKSLNAVGFVGTIIVDENDTVLAGHGRLEAAKLLDMDRVPTLRVNGLSDAQKRVFALADNKICENAGWDRDILVKELGELGPLLEPINCDLTLTGFEAAEIDALFADLGSATPDPDDTPLPVDKEVVNVANEARNLLLHGEEVSTVEARHGIEFSRLVNDVGRLAYISIINQFVPVLVNRQPTPMFLQASHYVRMNMSGVAHFQIGFTPDLQNPDPALFPKVQMTVDRVPRNEITDRAPEAGQ